MYYFISLLNSTMIGLEIRMLACEVIHASVEKVSLLYGIIALFINFIWGGGVAVKNLNGELCFVKESTIIHSEIILCLF